MRQEGCSFKPVKDRKWLLQAKVGLQNVAIVVCRDLPFEEKYFSWLAFAPTNTANWKRLVSTLIKTGSDWKLLSLIKRMRPEEVTKMLTKSIDEMIAEGRFTPEYVAQLQELKLLGDEYTIRSLAKSLPAKQFAMLFDLNKLLPTLPIKEILANIPAEKLLANISVEELLANIPAKELLAGIPAEERLAGIPADERLAGLSREQEEEIFKLLTEKRAQKNGKA